MRKLTLAFGVMFATAGVALFLWAQGHAYWLLWNTGNADMGRIHASGSDLVPFCLQLAIYEAGLGHWSSIELCAPVMALGTIALGCCIGTLGSMDWHEVPRLRRAARARCGVPPKGRRTVPHACPRCGSALGNGVTRCWSPGCSYEIGDWYP